MLQRSTSFTAFSLYFAFATGYGIAFLLLCQYKNVIVISFSSENYNKTLITVQDNQPLWPSEFNELALVLRSGFCFKCTYREIPLFADRLHSHYETTRENYQQQRKFNLSRKAFSFLMSSIVLENMLNNMMVCLICKHII